MTAESGSKRPDVPESLIIQGEKPGFRPADPFFGAKNAAAGRRTGLAERKAGLPACGRVFWSKNRGCRCAGGLFRAKAASAARRDSFREQETRALAGRRLF